MALTGSASGLTYALLTLAFTTVAKRPRHSFIPPLREGLPDETFLRGLKRRLLQQSGVY